ncbi:MAG: hypothetical protein NTV22_05300 [bacterium]|nr:hypothetical protein [bacterium]
MPMQRRRWLRVVMLLLLDVVLVYAAFPYFAASDLRKGLLQADPVRLRRWMDEPRLLRSLQEQFPQSAVTLTPCVVRAVIADGVPHETARTPLTLGNVHRAFFDNVTTFRVVYNQQHLVFELRGGWWRLTDIRTPSMPANARLAEPDAAVVMPADVPASEALGFTSLVARVVAPAAATASAPVPVAAAPQAKAAALAPAPALTVVTAARVRARMAEAEQKIRAFSRQHARELAKVYPGSLEVVRNRRRLAEYEQNVRDDYRARIAREFGVGEVDVELALLAGATNTPPTSAPLQP